MVEVKLNQKKGNLPSNLFNLWKSRICRMYDIIVWAYIYLFHDIFLFSDLSMLIVKILFFMIDCYDDTYTGPCCWYFWESHYKELAWWMDWRIRFRKGKSLLAYTVPSCGKKFSLTVDKLVNELKYWYWTYLST